jgi:cytosine/adenosine deaminase-related metal-dependent hydrolase
MGDLVLNFRMALLGEDLEVKENVNVEIRDGEISHIGNGFDSLGKTFGTGVALPGLVNSHSHAADFIVPEHGNTMSIREVVGDPKSLKYELLNSRTAEIPEGIVTFLRRSAKKGVIGVVDFREQGVKGVELALEARGRVKLPHYLILGRPEVGDPAELESLNRLADGVGISTPFSYDRDFLKVLAKTFAGKIRAVHISETFRHYLRGDLEYALQNFSPTLVVHGTHLSNTEMDALSERGVSLVLCPRSNLWFSSGIPNINDALNSNVKLLIGTDNGGWMDPDLWRDMEVALLLARLRDSTKSYGKEILKAATVNAYDMFGFTPLKEGSISPFVVIEGEETGIFRAKDVYTALVKRGGDVLSLFDPRELGG